MDSWPAGGAGLRRPHVTVCRAGLVDGKRSRLLGQAVQALGGFSTRHRLWAEETVPPLPAAPATFLPVQLPLGSNPQDGGTEVASADTGKEAVPGVGRGGDSADVATQPRDWMVKSGPPTTLLLLLLVFPERKKPCRFVLLSVAPILTQCLFPRRPRTCRPPSRCSVWRVRMRNGLTQTRSSQL